RVGAGAGDHGRAIADGVDRRGVQLEALVVGQGRRLARRARDHQPVGAVVDEVARQLAEPVVVDRAVLPERRHDRRQDLTQHAVDGTHRSASRPTVNPGGSDGSRSSASRTPGTNASREKMSWRIVSSSPGPPRSTSWWAISPGRRTEWIGGSPPIAAAVAFAVPEGASTFVSWWS